MEELKIEKGVPIQNYVERQRTDLLKKMEVGDSVFFKDKPAASIRQSFYNPAKRLGMRVSVRKWPGGCRVWRVE